MHKRIKAYSQQLSYSFYILFLPAGLPCKGGAGMTINVHYHRSGRYEGWNISWLDGKESTAYELPEKIIQQVATYTLIEDDITQVDLL